MEKKRRGRLRLFASWSYLSAACVLYQNAGQEGPYSRPVSGKTGILGTVSEKQGFVYGCVYATMETV